MADSFNELWGIGSHSDDADVAALWPLNESSGTRADSVGSLDLTDNNTVGSGTGPWGGTAADFELDNSESLSHADHATLDPGDTDYFFHVRVKLESKPASEDMTILAKDEIEVTDRQYRLQWDNGNDRFQWFVFDSSDSVAGGVLANTLGSPSLGAWYDILVWHSATDNEVGIRVNGGTADTSATTAAAGTGSAQFFIGQRDDGSGDMHFDGLISSVGMWSRVPTTSDGDELSAGPEPVNSVAPALSGTEQVGQTLSCTSGTWGLASPFSSGTNGTVTYAYQWTRSNDAGGTGESDIGGATSSTYTPVSADEGKFIRCRVRASNTGGYDADADTNSDMSGAIEAAPNTGAALLMAMIGQ